MKNLSKFQLIFLAIFILATLGGVAVLSLTKASTSKQAEKIVIWGTMPQDQFYAINGQDKTQLIGGTYVYKDPIKLYQDLLESIATGVSPDALVLTQAELYQYRGKITQIPYQSYTERLYKDTFIEGTEILTTTTGINAFPFAVDPMVMYWNRDIFDAMGSTKPPQYWDEFYDFAQAFTKQDKSLNITRSAVALGEYNNVVHAKDILATLIYQAGGRITSRDTSDTLTATLANSFNNPRNPAQSAVDFYMQFSAPEKPSYSWNRTLPDSKSTFIAGDLALYFGFASEIDEIKAKNPNLNFDVASMPQARGALVPTTEGNYWTMSIVRSSSHISAAFAALGTITGSAAGTNLITHTNLLPVRRDMLGVKQTRADKAVFYDAAFKSRSWIDPNNAETNKIFGELINMISSGRLTTSDAVNRAVQQLSQLLL